MIKIMWIKKIFLPAAFLLIAASLLLYWFSSKKVVAEIGDYKIVKSDVKQRDQIQNIFYPESKEAYGQQQLEKAFLYAQILKNNGFEITERILREEEIRIQQNTRDPKKLKQIQDLFGDDTDAYQKVFILPTYAERILYSEFFLKNPRAQAKSLARVQSFLNTLKERPNQSFQNLADEMRLSTQSFTISENGLIEFERKEKKAIPKPKQLIDQTEGSRPPQEIQKHLQAQQQAQTSESAKFWLEQVIPNLHPGEIVPEPVDLGPTWMAVRYKGKSGKLHRFEAVMFPKDDFNTWLEAEKAKVQIKK